MYKILYFKNLYFGKFKMCFRLCTFLLFQKLQKIQKNVDFPKTLCYNEDDLNRKSVKLLKKKEGYYFRQKRERVHHITFREAKA